MNSIYNFQDELEMMQDIIKEFINDMNKVNEDDTTEYWRKKESYSFLYYFNFDFLNYNITKNTDRSVVSFFENKTRLSNGELRLRILNEKKDRYRGDLDPDNMKIVRYILMFICKDKLESIFYNYRRVNEENLSGIEKIAKKTLNKKKEMEEQLGLYNKLDNIYMLRPDTMNSYNAVLGKRYSCICNSEYISDYDMHNYDEKRIVEYYYDYHKLGNFVLLPNETLLPLSERYLEWAEKISKDDGRVYIRRSDSINTYRGKNGLGIKTSFGNDDFYQLMVVMKDVKQRTDKVIELFKQNEYFFDCFSDNDLREYLILGEDVFRCYEERNRILKRDGIDNRVDIYVDYSNDVINLRIKYIIEKLYNTINWS